MGIIRDIVQRVRESLGGVLADDFVNTMLEKHVKSKVCSKICETYERYKDEPFALAILMAYLREEIEECGCMEGGEEE